MAALFNNYRVIHYLYKKKDKLNSYIINFSLFLLFFFSIFSTFSTFFYF